MMSAGTNVVVIVPGGGCGGTPIIVPGGGYGGTPVIVVGQGAHPIWQQAGPGFVGWPGGVVPGSVSSIGCGVVPAI